MDDTAAVAISKYGVGNMHDQRKKPYSLLAGRGTVQSSCTNKQSHMRYLSQQAADEPKVTVTNKKIIINQNTK